MPATLTPYGFQPTNIPNGARATARPYPIASGYGTAIYKNQPVILNTNGTITAGTANADLLGVFAGVEYTDATGKRVVSNFWPASTTATNVVAWVWDDPLMEYTVQCDGTLAQKDIGDQADVSNVSNNGNGISQCTLSATLAGASAQAQFRIVAFDGSVDNAPGDAYTKVIVRIARHQYLANKVAI